MCTDMLGVCIADESGLQGVSGELPADHVRGRGCAEIELRSCGKTCVQTRAPTRVQIWVRRRVRRHMCAPHVCGLSRICVGRSHAIPLGPQQFDKDTSSGLVNFGEVRTAERSCAIPVGPQYFNNGTSSRLANLVKTQIEERSDADRHVLSRAFGCVHRHVHTRTCVHVRDVCMGMRGHAHGHVHRRVHRYVV